MADFNVISSNESDDEGQDESAEQQNFISKENNVLKNDQPGTMEFHLNRRTQVIQANMSEQSEETGASAEDGAFGLENSCVAEAVGFLGDFVSECKDHETETKLQQNTLETSEELSNEFNSETTAVEVVSGIYSDFSEEEKEPCHQGEKVVQKSAIFSSPGGSLLNIKVNRVASETAEHLSEDELTSLESADFDSLESSSLNITVIGTSSDVNDEIRTKCSRDEEITSLESEAFTSCEDAFVNLDTVVINEEPVQSGDSGLNASSEEEDKELKTDVLEHPPCEAFASQESMSVNLSSPVTRETVGEKESELLLGHELNKNNQYENELTAGQYTDFPLEQNIHVDPENNSALNNTDSMKTEDLYYLCDEEENPLSHGEKTSEVIVYQPVSIVESHLVANGNPELEKEAYNADEESCEVGEQHLAPSAPQEHVHFVLAEDSVLNHENLGTLKNLELSHKGEETCAESEASADGSVFNCEFNKVSTETIELGNCNKCYDSSELKKDEDNMVSSGCCTDYENQYSDSNLKKDTLLNPDFFAANESGDSMKTADLYFDCEETNFSLPIEPQSTENHYAEVENSELGKEYHVDNENNELYGQKQASEEWAPEHILESETVDSVEVPFLRPSVGEGAEESEETDRYAQFEDKPFNKDEPISLEQHFDREIKREFSKTDVSEHLPHLEYDSCECLPCDLTSIQMSEAMVEVKVECELHSEHEGNENAELIAKENPDFCLEKDMYVNPCHNFVIDESMNSVKTVEELYFDCEEEENNLSEHSMEPAKEIDSQSLPLSKISHEIAESYNLIATENAEPEELVCHVSADGTLLRAHQLESSEPRKSSLETSTENSVLNPENGTVSNETVELKNLDLHEQLDDEQCNGNKLAHFELCASDGGKGLYEIGELQSLPYLEFDPRKDLSFNHSDTQRLGENLDEQMALELHSDHEGNNTEQCRDSELPTEQCIDFSLMEDSLGGETSVIQESLGETGVIQESLGETGVIQESLGETGVIQESLGETSVIQESLGETNVMQESLINHKNNLLVTETLPLQEEDSLVRHSKEYCADGHETIIEPISLPIEDSVPDNNLVCSESTKCEVNTKAFEKLEVEEHLAHQETAVTSPAYSDFILSGNQALDTKNIFRHDVVSEQEGNFNDDFIDYTVKEDGLLEHEIGAERVCVISDLTEDSLHLCVHDAPIAETGFQKTVDELFVNNGKSDLCVLGKLSSGQEECSTPSVGVLDLNMQTISSVGEKEQNMTHNEESSESADCVDFAKDPMMQCQYIAHSETFEPKEIKSHESYKQNDEKSHNGVLHQEQTTCTLVEESLWNRQYLSVCDEAVDANDHFVEDKQKLEDIHGHGELRCDRTVVFAEMNSLLSDSESTVVCVSKTVDFKVEESRAELNQDLENKISHVEPVLSQHVILDDVTNDVALENVNHEEENCHVNCKKDEKLSQWSELTPKPKHIDWEWKCKILEEEKSKLCEENKCLHSELELHLEKESSMSVQLDHLQNKFIAGESEFHLLESENLSHINDCQKLKAELESSLEHNKELEMAMMQCEKDKDDAIAQLHNELKLMTERHESLSRELELKCEEAAMVEKKSSESEVNKLKVENDLASSEEKVNSLSIALQEAAEAYEKLSEENNSLIDAVDCEKNLNTCLQNDFDSLMHTFTDQKLIISELKTNLINAEETITSKSSKIEELQKMVEVKERLLIEKSAAITELEQMESHSKHAMHDISSLLEGLQETISAHKLILSCEMESGTDINVLYENIEICVKNITQLIEILSATDICLPSDISPLIRNFTHYISYIQELLCMKQQLVFLLEAKCDEKDKELAEIRIQHVEKQNELNVLNERLKQVDFDYQVQNEKLQCVEEDFFFKTSQLENKDTKLAELSDELLHMSKAFKDDIQNLEARKAALETELAQKSNNIDALQLVINELEERLDKSEQSLKLKSDMFCSEDKVKTQQLLDEKERMLEKMEKECLENEIKHQELQKELIEVSQTLDNFLDKSQLARQLANVVESLPTLENEKVLEDTGNNYSQNEAENIPSIENELTVKCVETKATERGLLSEKSDEEHQFSRNDTSSTLDSIKSSFTAIQNKYLCLEKEYHDVSVALASNTKELSSLKAMLLNIEAICCNFVQGCDGCVDKTVSAAFENFTKTEELCNDLRKENVVLKSALSDKNGGFFTISHQLEVIENLIGECSEGGNVTVDQDGLLLRLTHIVDVLQDVNNTRLSKLIQPVFNETEEPVPCSTICEKIKDTSHMLQKLQEKNDIITSELSKKEQQCIALSLHLNSIEAELCGDLNTDICTDTENRVEQLIRKLQEDKMSNQQTIDMLADCEKNMMSLQTIIHDITKMLEERLKKNICETQLTETIKHVLDKKAQLEDEVNRGKSHFESCNKLMEYYQNQIKFLEDANSELKANFESCKSTVYSVCQEKDDLEKSLNEKLTLLSTELSTLMDETAELKSKYEVSEKLAKNYKEEIASLRKVKLQLNATIEEIEEDLQNTYTEREELKAKLNNITAETEHLKKAMQIENEDLDSSVSLIHQYNEVINSLKTENCEMKEKLIEVEKKLLRESSENENLAIIISELREQLKSLQDSVQEKDVHSEALESKLKSSDIIISNLTTEIEANEVAKVQLNSMIEESEKKLHKANTERLTLMDKNESLLYEMEVLKQAQLSAVKSDTSDREILAKEMEKLNEQCESLRQYLHEKNGEIDNLKFEKGQLLENFNELKRELEVSHSKDEEYCEVTETNKKLNALVKDLEHRVIEIEDENLSAYEKLDSIETEKSEAEKEWIRKYKTFWHQLEALNTKISDLNKILFKMDIEVHKFHNSAEFLNNFSEQVEKDTKLSSGFSNDSDQLESWKALNCNFDVFRKKFLGFLKNAEDVVKQKNEVVEKLSIANVNTEKRQHEIDSWISVHKKIAGFVSDFITEMNIPKPVLKSVPLNTKEWEDDLLRDLQMIRKHFLQKNKENDLLKRKMEKQEKLISELKTKKEEISQEYETEKKKNLDSTSQLVHSKFLLETRSQDMQHLQQAKSKLEEKVRVLHLQVNNLKQKETDINKKNEEMESKLKILSSELTELLNENKRLDDENSDLIAKLGSRKEFGRETDLEKHIVCLKQKLNEYEDEIMQLKAEKQQSQALNSLQDSDMTVCMSMFELLSKSEVPTSQHLVGNSNRVNVANKSISCTPSSCDDNFTDEIKNSVATILQILCVENTHLPLNKQLDLIKDKVTSLLGNCTTSFQLAKELCKEVIPNCGEFEGKSPSDLLSTLGSRFKKQQRLISKMNEKICDHIETVGFFMKKLSEISQLMKSMNTLGSANICDFAMTFEHVTKVPDTSHLYTKFGSVDHILERGVVPFLNILKDRVHRKPDAILNEALMQEKRKVAVLEAKVQDLEKAKKEYEGKLRIQIHDAQVLEKSHLALQEENNLLEKQLGLKEGKGAVSLGIKELCGKVRTLEKKCEQSQSQLYDVTERLNNSVKENEHLEKQCQWLSTKLRYHQKQEQRKVQKENPVSNQMDHSVSSSDSDDDDEKLMVTRNRIISGTSSDSDDDTELRVPPQRLLSKKELLSAAKVPSGMEEPSKDSDNPGLDSLQRVPPPVCN